MKREQWEFSYSGKALYAAAMKKYRLHASRLKWWREQKKKVMAEVRSRGLTVEETIAAAYGTSNTYNVIKGIDQRAIITVDTRLQGKLNECASKIGLHSGRTGEYDSWCQVLRAHPKQSFYLNQDDYLFFFGK